MVSVGAARSARARCGRGRASLERVAEVAEELVTALEHAQHVEARALLLELVGADDIDGAWKVQRRPLPNGTLSVSSTSC